MSGWRLSYDHYDPEREMLREVLCATGNGNFVTRAASPDSHHDGTHYPGTYLAGGYNRAVTEIQDRPVENEDLVNLPNWLPLTFCIEGDEWFAMDRVELLDYWQAVDVWSGLLTRILRFRDGEGRISRWAERRLVSMSDPHLAALEVQLTAENWSGDITVRSALDGTVSNNGVARYRELEGRHLEVLDTHQPLSGIISLLARTRQSRLEVAEAARTRLYRPTTAGEPPVRRECLHRQGWIGEDLHTRLNQGESLVVEKTVALHTSRDTAISEAGLAAREAVAQAGRFEALLAAHQIAWENLWENGDIVIRTHDSDQANLKLRVHLFHLFQTLSPHTVERDIGGPARGWHGEAYRGHIFWDELFIFPYLNLRQPLLTRGLLRYRHRRLPAARRAAREAGFEGAMFPWQSGSDGREESQQLHLNPKSGRWIPDNTHRQRHINAAIAYNIWHYLQATDDLAFLAEYGAEMLVEISRFWASIARYNQAQQRYEIHHVMGPDEYHTAYPDADPEAEGGLSNNAYTNVMASWVLMRTLDALQLLPESRRRQLDRRLGLEERELRHWENVSRNLKVPFHEDGIISQFEGYEQLREFDWAGYREKYGDIQRLDRILEAEDDTPNRYKVSKQADVLMLFYLFSADELHQQLDWLGYPVAEDLIPRNIDYYLARSSHGSTLSYVVHSWVLARARRPEAWSLFQQALDSDLRDIQGGTTHEGIHLGAMASTVDLAQRCFTGLESRAGVLHFNPVLPEEVESLTVWLRYHSHSLEVNIDQERLVLECHRHSAGSPITVAYRGHARRLAPGDRYSFRLIRAAERDRDESRHCRAESRRENPEHRNL